MAVGLCEKADRSGRMVHWGHRHHSSAYHRWLKRAKNRAERRRAKLEPECVPGYGRYRGWET